jgi:2-methylcitrate dehydratase PrpD
VPFNQSPVINAINLRQNINSPIELIKHIVIEMNDYEANYPGMSSKGPFSSISQTLMSAPYCVAASLLDGDVTLDGLKRFNHETLNQLIAKTTVVPQKDIKPLCNKITVELEDNRQLFSEMNITNDFYKFDAEKDIQLIKGIVNEMRITPYQLEQLIDAFLHLEEKNNFSNVILNLSSAG